MDFAGFVFGENEMEVKEKAIPDPDGAAPDPFVFSDEFFGGKTTPSPNKEFMYRPE